MHMHACMHICTYPTYLPCLPSLPTLPDLPPYPTLPTLSYLALTYMCLRTFCMVRSTSSTARYVSHKNLSHGTCWVGRIVAREGGGLLNQVIVGFCDKGRMVGC